MITLMIFLAVFNHFPTDIRIYCKHPCREVVISGLWLQMQPWSWYHSLVSVMPFLGKVIRVAKHPSNHFYKHWKGAPRHAACHCSWPFLSHLTTEMKEELTFPCLFNSRIGKQLIKLILIWLVALEGREEICPIFLFFSKFYWPWTIIAPCSKLNTMHHAPRSPPMQ